MRQRGFTLLELLAVLVLISIAMAILVSGMARGFSGMNERHTVDKLVQALRQGHVMAMVERRPVQIGLDLASLCYHLDSRPPQCLPAGYTMTAQVGADNSESDTGFTFHPDGSSSGGNLQLRTPTRSVRIDVSWLTSNATVVPL